MTWGWFEREKIRLTLWRERRRERKHLEDELLRARMEVRKQVRGYEAAIKEAKDSQEAEEVRRERSDVMRYFEDPVRRLEGQLLLMHAEDNHVSSPSWGDEEHWEEASYGHGRLLLTDLAVSKLRREIEEAKRAKASHRIAWVGAITGLSAVLGTLLPGVITALKGIKP